MLRPRHIGSWVGIHITATSRNIVRVTIWLILDIPPFTVKPGAADAIFTIVTFDTPSTIVTLVTIDTIVTMFAIITAMTVVNKATTNTLVASVAVSTSGIHFLALR